MKTSLSILLFALAWVSVAAPKDSLSKVKDELLKPVKFNLSQEGDRYIQFTGLVQTWMRYTDLNPNTTINGVAETNVFDIGIRRARFQIIGQLSSNFFFYSQLGMNSFSFLSERKYGFFIHDMVGEYHVKPHQLAFGMGLDSWVGPLRYSAPGVGNIMGMDLPIYQQTTNDINDQFVRRLAFYLKGFKGRFDYRASIAKPFIVNYSKAIPIPGSQAAVPLLGTLDNNISTFSIENPSPQFNGYFKYHFKDKEENKLPYNTGTYLGKKKIVTVGAGIQFQKNAVWHKELNQNGQIDTVRTNFFITGVDLIIELPVHKQSTDMLHIYLSWMYSDYGVNYIRNFAPMNPADNGVVGYNTSSKYNSGGGAAYPMNGTGQTLFTQIGYKFKNNLLGNNGTLMPYTMIQLSSYKAIDKAVLVYDIGINWLISGHNSKISLNYQNRPYFYQTASTEPILSGDRRGMYVLQYQVSF